MNTRWLAACVITRVLKDGISLTVALDEAIEKAPSQQDKAFVQAICYGVCRYYHRLHHMLTQLVDKPIKSPEISSLLLIGLYQLEFMRVKPYAAVSETVMAAKKLAWSKGLINGVLRNYQRNQDKLNHLIDTNKEASSSHPAWLIAMIEQDWPDNANMIFQENNRQPPMVLRVNQRKISTEAYREQLDERYILSSLNASTPVTLTLEAPMAVEMLPGFFEGMVSIQDGAAQLAAGLLDLQPEQRVLDVCAAPGGKTAHLLELEPRLKEVVAVDIDATRMQRVNDNLNRLHLHATLIIGDASAPKNWWDDNQFDRILLDAPCSATGVIRRHPDIKLLRRPDDIRQLSLNQMKILESIWPLLRPGGMILYATCSILKQENEEQIEKFLKEHADAVEKPIEKVAWGIACRHGRQILTGDGLMDGFYYARLVKKT
jgi:16S rRNA (cytosine967-C5)-methyltransferase